MFVTELVRAPFFVFPEPLTFEFWPEPEEFEKVVLDAEEVGKKISTEDA